MSTGVLSRFIKYMFISILVMGMGYIIFQGIGNREPGDYYTEVCGIRLRDKLYGEAMENFDKALEERPNHRGALMGRALVFIQTEKYGSAVKELSHLIGYLTKTLQADDKTGYAVLAAAYANRGIVHDRQARYRMALKDYISSLKIDQEAVSGPGIMHKVLYGEARPATVRKRAIYLVEQLKLPPGKRRLRLPEVDKKQRMYKP